MKWSGSAPHFQYSENVQKLQSLSRQLHDSLKDLETEIKNEKCYSRLKKTVVSAQQLSTLSSEFSRLQTFVLSEEEYVTFCDFIICGSEMAQYLAEHKLVKKTMRNHARYWLNLVKKFRPFLRKSMG